MAELSFHIEGIEEVTRAFAKLPDEVARRIQRQVVRQAAAVVSSAAKRHAPVDEGVFRKAQGVRIRTYEKGDVVVAIVGSRRDVIKGIRPANIDALLEEGWRIAVGGNKSSSKGEGGGGQGVRVHPGFHVMRRAFEESRAQVTQILTSGALAAVSEAVEVLKHGG